MSLSSIIRESVCLVKDLLKESPAAGEDSTEIFTHEKEESQGVQLYKFGILQCSLASPGSALVSGRP
jgi:hypothetical protein